MSIHENTHPQTQKQKQKHKDKHKSTIAIKQRKKNAQATTESETENITDQEELLLLAETELVQGGEEQLWELFLPLSPLLPANILYHTSAENHQYSGIKTSKTKKNAFTNLPILLLFVWLMQKSSSNFFFDLLPLSYINSF